MEAEKPNTGKREQSRYREAWCVGRMDRNASRRPSLGCARCFNSNVGEQERRSERVRWGEGGGKGEEASRAWEGCVNGWAR
eukprot:scaffold148340_cov34-Tisochrysis_lutea.AAC.1